MKTIEDQFQEIGDGIVAGRLSLNPSEHEIVSNFYALWRIRAQHREAPVPDQPLRGITPNPLTLDQEENLEKNGYIFADAKGVFPGRMLAGFAIQREIDWMTHQLKNEKWGIFEARGGEFVAPDFFDITPVVPLTPKLCLVAASGDTVLSRTGVLELNRLAISSSRQYLVAHDFSKCPL